MSGGSTWFLEAPTSLKIRPGCSIMSQIWIYLKKVKNLVLPSHCWGCRLRMQEAFPWCFLKQLTKWQGRRHWLANLKTCNSQTMRQVWQAPLKLDKNYSKIWMVQCCLTVLRPSLLRSLFSKRKNFIFSPKTTTCVKVWNFQPTQSTT